MSGDDVAGRILADVLGPRLIEDDYWCYQTFRDEFMAPRLAESEWSLTDSDVRDWRAAYVEQMTKKRPASPLLTDDEEAHQTQSAVQDEPTDAAPDESASAASDDDDALDGAASAPEPASRETKSAPGAVANRPQAQPQHVEQQALVSWPTGFTRARILHSSPSVVLLEGEQPPGGVPPNGSAIRLGLPGLPKMLSGRLAAYGQGGRYLVALGTRAVRGALRVRVDLPGVIRAATLWAPLSVRVVDLSSSGAHVRGVRLPVNSECELRFVPPGRADSVRLRCVVVRPVDEPDQGDMALAFCGGPLTFSVDLARPRPPTTS